MVRTPTESHVSGRVVGLLVLLALLPYLNALTADFTLDDLPNVRENAAVTGGVDLTEIVATPLPLMANLYRPMTVLSFAVNEALTPGNAAVFHAVNLLLHAGVTLAVFCLALRLFDQPVAVIAAVVFALHPVHTEAVTSIVGRAELLAAFFGLLAVLSAPARDAAAGRWPRRGWLALSVLSFALAVLSKESAVTILPLVLLYRIARRGEPLFAGAWAEIRSLDWVPYALCLGVFLLLRSLVVGTFASMPVSQLTPLDNVLAFMPWPLRLRSALGVLWDYFGLLNFPLLLAADYSYNQVPPVTSWADPRWMAGASLLLVVAVATLRWRRPAVNFAALFPVVALLLTANLLFPIGTVKAERLLYLPSVGWALLAAYGCDRLLRVPRYRVAAVAGLAVACTCFSTRTWLRNADWQTNMALAQSMASSAPQSAKSRANFGVALLQQGYRTAAIEQFAASLAIYPLDESAFGIGTALNEQGKTDEAIAWLRRAIEITPALHKAHTDLCHTFWRRGDYAAAVRACRNGLRYDPADANLLKGLGSSLLGAGETEKGTEVLRRSLALNPSDEGLRRFLAARGTAVARRDETREGLQ